MRLSNVLAPRDREFFDLFEEAGGNIQRAVGLLEELLNEYPERNELAREILICEQDGDRITHDIIQRLNQTFVTPIDREDIYQLATALDDVLDAVEAVSDLFVLHRIAAPLPEMVAQTGVLMLAARQTEHAFRSLRDMRRDRLEPYWIEINRLENEGDRLYRRAVADLFSGEHRAMDVLKWKEVIENLEEALDGLENVSNIIESIVLKHA